jgi:predicted dehydrogenase
MSKAKAQAEKYGVPKACTVDELMADTSVEAVLNLTIPHAHTLVASQAIAAGKHVYGEKPLAVTRADGKKVLETAAKRKVRVGGAPDTFLGGAIQTCVKLINDGAIGEPVAATAFMLCRGHETWHPSPEFYYQPGGGPMFDMGPYYLTALVALLGPARRVSGSTRKSFAERTITSQPKHGQIIKVNTPTHLAGTVDFANGAIATIITSFDVYAHRLPNIEIYGTEGSLRVPDPNSFGQGRDALHPIQLWSAGKREWVDAEYSHGYRKNSRGVGLADMARAIKNNREHRASGEMTYHVLDIMQSFIDSSEQGKHIELQSTCARPKPFPVGLEDGEVDD